jgi:hypothetical protein
MLLLAYCCNSILQPVDEVLCTDILAFIMRFSILVFQYPVLCKVRLQCERNPGLLCFD